MRLFAGLLLLLASSIAHAQTDRVLRIVSPLEIGTLEPARHGFVFTRMQVAETLMGADDGGLPTPGLATSWAVSEDRLSWRFTLREGATFHDGTPVTSEAVAAALRRAKSAPGPFQGAPVTGFETPDPRTVVVRLSEPFSALPAFLANYGTQVLAPSSFDEKGAVRQVIGSGPYRITRIEQPLRFDVTRFAGWTGGPTPAIEQASYQAVSRAETRAVMAESGQADLVFVLDPPSQDRLRRGRRVDMRVMAIPRTQVLKVNAALPFFDDLRERQAISLLIDRASIARAILRNPEAPATQLFPPMLAEWYRPELAPLRHDVAEARRLLAECGWVPGPGGVLMQNGKPFRVTLRTFTDRPELPVVATALQEQFREGGIDLQVAVGNSSEIPAGHRDGTLELALFARNFSLVPDPIGTMREDYGPGGADYGAMGWSSAELTDVLARLGPVADPVQRAALRGRAATILHDQLPTIPIAWYDLSAAIGRRVANVSLDPLELSYRISVMRWAE